MRSRIFVFLVAPLVRFAAGAEGDDGIVSVEVAVVRLEERDGSDEIEGIDDEDTGAVSALVTKSSGTSWTAESTSTSVICWIAGVASICSHCSFSTRLADCVKRDWWKVCRKVFDW